MGKIKKFLKKLVNRETVLYVVFGVLTTLVSVGTFTLLNYIFAKTGLSGAMTINGVVGKIIDKFNGNKDLSYLVSNTVSWIFAVAFAFVTNKLFVFKSKSWTFRIAGKELIAFIGARAFSLLLEKSIENNMKNSDWKRYVATSDRCLKFFI